MKTKQLVATLALSSLAIVGGAGLVYHLRQQQAANLGKHLVQAIRDHYREQTIQVVWLEETASDDGDYKGGLVLVNGGQVETINVKIHPKTLRITEQGVR